MAEWENLGRTNYKNKIARQLGMMASAAKMSAAENRTDFAVDAEDTICGLLNLIKGWNLTNANTSKQRNYPAVDLIDKDGGIAVQVTVQDKTTKVDEMLKQFKEHKLNREYFRLILLVITDEAPKKSMQEKEGMCFYGYRDLWTLKTLLQDINGMSVDKQKQIADYLDKELGIVCAESGNDLAEKTRNHPRLSDKNLELRNTLMKNGFADEETERQKSAFNTNAKRCEVGAIYFLDSMALAPDDAADASQIQNGTVKAWTRKTGDLYDLFIAAEGKIYAPDNSGNLFREMINLTAIHFNDAFSTKNADNMRSMFQNCRNLKKLEIGFFETAQVTDMAGMFCYCSSLSELDVSSFDTSHVETIYSMFFGCSGLMKLKLGRMDTSRISDMYAMFYYCARLTALDLSAFDTSLVTSMKNMLNGCEKLTDLNIAGWDLSSVKNYDNFMSAGMTVNGRPWEELFTGRE